MIIQHMTSVLTSSHSFLPYDMLLTTIFYHFGLDLDGETHIRMSKPSNAMIIASWHDWVEKATRAPVVEVDSDEEVDMDILLTSPTDAL